MEEGLHQPLGFVQPSPTGRNVHIGVGALFYPGEGASSRGCLRTVAATSGISSEVVSAPVRVEIPRGIRGFT